MQSETHRVPRTRRFPSIVLYTRRRQRSLRIPYTPPLAALGKGRHERVVHGDGDEVAVHSGDAVDLVGVPIARERLALARGEVPRHHPAAVVARVRVAAVGADRERCDGLVVALQETGEKKCGLG